MQVRTRMVPKMTTETRAVVVQKPVQSKCAYLPVYLRARASVRVLVYGGVRKCVFCLKP